ncbi:unnamed protein product, partial [Ectocarpus sp. 13 AM-2016]
QPSPHTFLVDERADSRETFQTHEEYHPHTRPSVKLACNPIADYCSVQHQGACFLRLSSHLNRTPRESGVTESWLRVLFPSSKLILRMSGDLNLGLWLVTCGL